MYIKLVHRIQWKKSRQQSPQFGFHRMVILTLRAKKKNRPQERGIRQMETRQGAGWTENRVIYQGCGETGRSETGQVEKWGTSLRNNTGNTSMRHKNNLAESVCNAGASVPVKTGVLDWLRTEESHRWTGNPWWLWSRRQHISTPLTFGTTALVGWSAW